MRVAATVIISLFMVGCTITVTDKRLPPEQIVEGFKAHDKAIQDIVNIMNAMREKVLWLEKNTSTVKKQK